MAKRAGHPALALQKMERRADTEVKDILHSWEWHRLPVEDKRFMIQYLQLRDYKKAQRAAKVSTEWLAEREQDPRFKEVLEKALELPVQVSLLMAKEAVPHSMVVLLSLIDQEENKTVALNAVKHLHNITGLVPEEPVGIQNNQWNITVKHWNQTLDPPELEGNVVDSGD